jgi:hypothetical protein
VPFKDGRPEGYYENFVTGFWASGEQRAEVWGRLAALAVAKDGALLVANDTGGTDLAHRLQGPCRACRRAGCETSGSQAVTPLEEKLETIGEWCFLSPLPVAPAKAGAQGFTRGVGCPLFKPEAGSGCTLSRA